MSLWVKQSTAVILKLGPFVDSTDGVTPETALTIAQADIQVSKNGGAFAQTSATTPTTTHDADGWYPIPLTATDTGTLGTLVVQVAMSGAIPVWGEFMVVPANVWDSFFGADKLQVDAVEVSSDSAAADNLELFVEGTALGTLPKVNSTEVGGVAPESAANIADAVWDEDIVAAHGTADTAGETLSQLTKRSVTLSTEVVAGSVIDQMIDDGTASYDRTTDSLQALRDRGDAAWITGAGSGLTAIASGTAQSGTVSTIQLAAGETFADDEPNGCMIYIHTGTGAGQCRLITDYVGATDTATVNANWTTTPDATSQYEIWPGTVNAAQVGGTAPVTAADIRSEIDSNSTQLAAIVADTNELQGDWVDGGRLDLLLDAIKAVTDALPDSGALTSLAQASALTTVDTVVDAIKVVTDALGSTAAAKLALSTVGIVSGAAQTGTLSTTQMTTDLAETTDDHYIGRVVVWTSGALAGQAREITDYSGTSGLVTFAATTEAPSNGDTFVIV